ncbi:MAG: hypothetical protein H8E82_06885 [Candidatus Marinimicrobia bacterium]|nr:hypothetical protein [Candidatus Neomarinimicrobiota bacterium]
MLPRTPLPWWERKKGEGGFFYSLPALILREQAGHQFLRNKNDESFIKIESDLHWITLV